MKIDRLVSLALVVVSVGMWGCVPASKGAASPSSAWSASPRDPSDDSYMERYERGDKAARVSRTLDHHLGAL